MIKLKRVYDAAATSDGSRLLVERLWPRGVPKANLKIDAWLKDVGPSHDLRRWFAHDPKRWNIFCSDTSLNWSLIRRFGNQWFKLLDAERSP
jgi:uncharacterized protein YeaO (DUF488 family)